MIISFVFPSGKNRTGGIVALFEYANALARRGHEVHFVHGPWSEHRVERLEDVPFRFDHRVRQYLVDSLDDPSLPVGDVVFHPTLARLGHPVAFIQGFRMVGQDLERETMRARAPKVCVARWLVDVCRAFGAPPEQLWHVPYGIDRDVFAMRTALEDRTVDVAMLHNPHREKGWDVGLEVLRDLARRRRDFNAVVFGRPKPKQQLPPGVRFMQDPSHEQLADEVYNAARVFVQPSYHEGFGFTPVEAMACGAALVTTDCRGSRDYGLHGETARVVAAGDATALVGEVDALLDDDNARGTLASAGAAYVRRFDWDRSAAVLEENLERYLADPEAFQRPPGEPSDELLAVAAGDVSGARS